MNNSLPNSYLFSRYNDFGLSEKKYFYDFLYKRHPEQPESFKQYKWPMFLKLSFMEMKNTPKFAFASDIYVPGWVGRNSQVVQGK